MRYNQIYFVRLLATALLLISACNSDDQIEFDLKEIWRTEISNSNNLRRGTPIVLKDYVAIPYDSGPGILALQIIDKSNGDLKSNIVKAGILREFQTNSRYTNELMIESHTGLVCHNFESIDSSFLFDYRVPRDINVSENIYLFNSREDSPPRYKLKAAEFCTTDTLTIREGNIFENDEFFIFHHAEVETMENGKRTVYTIHGKQFFAFDVMDTLFVSAIDFDTQEIIWERDFDVYYSYSLVTPQIANFAVIVPGSSSSCVGLSKIDGSVIWEIELGEGVREFWNETKLIDDKVFIRSANNRVSCINALSGKVLWVEDYVSSGNFKISKDRYFYLNSSNGDLYSKSTIGNELKFVLELPNDFNSYIRRFSIDDSNKRIYLNDISEVVAIEYE